MNKIKNKLIKLFGGYTKEDLATATEKLTSYTEELSAELLELRAKQIPTYNYEYRLVNYIPKELSAKFEVPKELSKTITGSMLKKKAAELFSEDPSFIEAMKFEKDFNPQTMNDVYRASIVIALMDKK